MSERLSGCGQILAPADRCLSACWRGEAFDNFRVKRQVAAKCKTEAKNSDDNREEGTSQKRHRIRKRAAEDEMDVDTDILVQPVSFLDVGSGH
jgi:hypothetical protein